MADDVRTSPDSDIVTCLGHEVYQITDAQLDEWKKSAEPLEKQWAENVRKAGGDPDTIMKELKQSLAQYKAGY